MSNLLNNNELGGGQDLLLRRRMMMQKADTIPPDNEIWYTSYDGNVVTTSGVPNLVSNTYSGGKGVITASRTITNLGHSAFLKKSQLKTITMPRTLTSIYSWCFEQSGVKRLDLTYVNHLDPNGSIYRMPNCTEVIIGPGITVLPMYFLSNCDIIERVDIPSNVLSIGTTFGRSAPLLLTVIMRGATPPALADSTLFTTNANRLMYVPDAAYESYLSTTVYSDYASRIKRISELPI